MLLFVFLTGCLLIVYLYYVLTIRAKKRKKLLNKEYESISAVKRIALAHTRYCISKLEEYERTLN